MSEHRWGPTFKCTNLGCRITRHAVHAHLWRLGGYGAKWRETAIPPCRGAARCIYVERTPLALGAGHAVRGGIKVGECNRPPLPRMVVCEHHATPDALRMVILAMAEEIERLKGTGHE